MRLDKYLKVSRLIKRRTVANEACDAGRVLINGTVAKASAKVKVGDIIEIQFGGKTVKIEVLDIPTGYTHNIENLGDTDMVTFMWANECFNPEKPDTFFEEV